MKYLKYFLIVFILILCPSVYAAEQNISSKIEAIPGFGGGTYYATQPVSVPVPLYQNIGTRYNGKLSLVEFYLDNDDWNWNYNKTYTITLNMSTEDWRNNFMGPQVIQCNCDGSQQSSSSSSYVSNTFRFVSYKTIKFNFKLGSSMGCKTKFRVYSTNTTNTAITGISNYNLSRIVISDITSAPTPTPVNPSPTATPAPNNQDIINNQKQNTQDIINNQSQNTQDVINNNTQNTSDIIENNNQNSQNIIDNQKTTEADNTRNNLDTSTQNCGSLYKYNILMGRGYYSNGTQYIDFNTFYIDDYVSLAGAKKLVLTDFNDSNNGNIIIYDSNKNYIDYWGVRNQTITLPSNAAYFRYSTTIPTGRIFKDKACTSKLDETNDYLMDNTDPNIQDNDFLNTFNSVGFSDPLNYLLTLPTQLINKIVSLSNSCSPIELGTLYGTMLTMPCINIENYVGSSVWNIIDVIFSVSLLVVILKNLYDTFSNLLTMGAEKEAKEKFSMPTPMDFLSMILGGDR